MSSAILFITNGFEETEALMTADILRRGESALTIASLTRDLYVTGSHGITVKADEMFDEAVRKDYDMLILPGGPGAEDYRGHGGLRSLVCEYYEKGRYISAICAAPVFLGELGLLRGREALCYPSLKDKLAETGAIKPGNMNALVVTDGKLTTSIGPGTTAIFALRLVELLEGSETSLRVSGAFIVS